MPRLDDWSLTLYFSGSSASLLGTVTGHPKCEDGHRIVTSKILMLDVGNRVAKTRNTSYELGEPEEGWVAVLKTLGRTPEFYNMEETCVTKTRSTPT
jgi:hypothetical protein